MNLDLLSKLVRLANNNPNENEANLAARKVCKMIEENKFQFGDVKQNNTPPRKDPYKEPWVDPLMEVIRKMNEERQKWAAAEVKREQEEANQRAKEEARRPAYKRPVSKKSRYPDLTDFSFDWGSSINDFHYNADPEKASAKAEWVYDNATSTFVNLRTKQRITRESFEIKFGRP